MTARRKPGRPAEIAGGSRYRMLVLDGSRFDELLEIYPNKSASQVVRDLVEDELERINERKNQVGSNPIRVEYEDHPLLQQRQASLLEYLQTVVIENIEDQTELSHMKGLLHGISKRIDVHSMVLRARTPSRIMFDIGDN